MVGDGQAIGTAQAVGNERGVASQAGHVAFLCGKNEQMSEVEVACFQQSHDLQPFDGFTVEGDGGGLHKLGDETAQGDAVGDQVTGLCQTQQTVQQGIGVEDAFFPQHIGGRRAGDGLHHLAEPTEQKLVLVLRRERLEQEGSEVVGRQLLRRGMVVVLFL